MRRVGNMRIMVVEAIRDIPAGVELSVSYGLDYYGPNTKKRCYCRSRKCVSAPRKAMVVDDIYAALKKRKVKKCSRLTPPSESL
jgi:SET domain-containing protein